MITEQAGQKIIYDPLDYSYELFEVNSPELLEAIKENKSLVFKGEVEDTLILCTEKATFQVQQLCCSNSHLICESGDYNIMKTRTINQFILEPRLVRPDFKRLDEFLENSYYDFPDLPTPKLYTKEYLSEKIQASQFEIDRYLDKIGAFTFNGTLVLDLIFRIYEKILSKVFG